MEIFFHNTFNLIDSSKYFLLFIGCLFEGPVVMIMSGFLYSLGSFSFLPMYSTLVLGDFVADIGWYSLGRFGTRNIIYKYGHFVGVTPELITKAENYFNKFHQKILISTKLTTGFGFAIIILTVAGIFKVPFKNYMAITFLGGLIWTIFLLSIGYFFGNIFIVVPGQLKIIFAIIITIIFIIGMKYTKKYFKNKLL